MITDWLVAHRGLAPAVVAEASMLARKRRQRTEHVLSGLGRVDDQTLAEAYAAQLNLPLLQDQDLPHQSPFRTRVQAEFLIHNGVLPLAEDPEWLDLAMQDPLDEDAAKAVALYFNRQIRRHVATPKQIQEWIARLFGAEDGAAGGAATPAPTAVPLRAEALRDLQERSSDAPAVQWLNDAVAQAARARASDIHLEQQEKGLRYRQRIDGVLVDQPAPPAPLAAGIVSRVKVLSGLDIAERRRPQDGRMRHVVDGREIDIRISVVPTLHGEGVVLRLLDRDTAPLALSRLGFRPALLTSVDQALQHRHGLVLVTGPTGSGKTTTLYAALRQFETAPVKIVTVEDPIEYHMEGLTQIQVRADIGVGFAENLRAVLRHDPDIILIGEIRDGETAQIAVQAALTGHLVLATLHTNDALSAIPRLRDMGIEPYLIASTLRAVIAQRLCRKLCPHCADSDPEAVKWLARQANSSMWRSMAGVAAPQMHKAIGCAACGGLGYNGRTVIAECLHINDTLVQNIVDGSGASEILENGHSSAMVPLFDDGVAKAVAGLTSLTEVMRVTDQVFRDATDDAAL